MEGFSKNPCCTQPVKIIALIIGTCILISPITAMEDKIYLDNTVVNVNELIDKQGPVVETAETSEVQRLIVQFKEIPSKEKRAEIESESEITFLSYIPDNSWIVKGKTKEIRQLKSLNPVYISEYKDKYRLSNQLSKGKFFQRSINQQGTLNLAVEFFSDIKKTNQRDILLEYGSITGKEKYGGRWAVKIPKNKFNQLKQEKTVKKISNKRGDIQALNNLARKTINADNVQKPPFNLTGEGFTAALWDLGWAGKHPDIENKTIIGDDSNECSTCNYTEHATHVAGTMLGSGNLDNNLRGVAPNADLITHEVYTNSTILKNTNESARNNDAVLSQNSWGKKINNKPEMGNYDFLSENFDEIVRGEKNIPRTSVIFSAGNERTKWNIEYNTTTSYGSTAKNTITVGAVDSNEDMTSYSSWGPTDDGRIKPDLVAVGGDSFEGVNSTIQNTSENYPYSEKIGTSMASPAVSGTALLMNEQFNKSFNYLPQPATTKAILIQTAKDLGREGPDYEYGWGLVNTTEAIKYVKNSESLTKRDQINSTGQNKSYSFYIPENKSDIKFTLVWSDYPGESSSKTLINDLDLSVETPNGTKAYPWTLEGYSDPNASASKDSEDHRNTVEQVEISEPSSGIYNVTVNGHAVPYPQTFSLVGPKESNFNIDIINPKDLVKTPELNVYSKENITEWKYNIDDRSNVTFTPNITLSNVTTGKRNITVWGKNQAGTWSNSIKKFTVDQQGPNIYPIEPENSSFVNEQFNLTGFSNDNFTNVTEFTYRLEKNGSLLLNESLNDTINTENYTDGYKDIKLSSKDFFDNERNISLKIGFDNTKPEININKTEYRYISNATNISASAFDNLSSIEELEYRIEKNNTNLTDWKSNNTQLNTSNLDNGEYNLSFNAIDKAGNQNQSYQISTVIDNLKPNATSKLNFTKTNLTSFKSTAYNSKNTNLSSIWISWKNSTEKELTDSFSKIEKYQIQKRHSKFNSSKESFHNTSNWKTVKEFSKISNSSNTSKINLTNNSRNEISLVVVDKAGNTNRSNIIEIVSDNSDPLSVNQSVEPLNWTNKDNVIFNISAKEISSIKQAKFTLNNSNKSVIDSKINSNKKYIFNLTSKNSFDLNHSEYYKAEVNITDIFNNTINDSWAFKTDFRKPKLSISGFKDNKSVELGKWAKNNQTIEITCSESKNESGISQSSIKLEDEFQKTTGKKQLNKTVKVEGENNISLSCKDLADNTNLNFQKIKIDTQRPTLSSINLDNNSVVSKDKIISGDIIGEDKGSGINNNQSFVKLQDNSETTKLNNNSFELNASLEKGNNYHLKGNLTDFVGFSTIFFYKFSVEEEEEDSDDSTTTSSSGGGFSTTSSNDTQESNNTNIDENSNEEEENITAEFSENEENNTDNQDNSSSTEKVTIESINASFDESSIITEISFNNLDTGKRNYTLNFSLNGRNYTETVTVDEGSTNQKIILPSSNTETEKLSVNGQNIELDRSEEKSRNDSSAYTALIILVIIIIISLIGYSKYSSIIERKFFNQKNTENIQQAKEQKKTKGWG